MKDITKMNNFIAKIEIRFCSWQHFLIIFTPPVLFIAFLYYLGNPYIYEVMNDPIGILNGEIWIGVGSNLGVSIWGYSAAVSIFAGGILYASKHEKDAAYFLILLGSLTLVLSLDDLFLIHDVVMPHFGLSEYIIYFMYAFVGLLILVKYIKVISKTENILFYIGGILFCSSILIDMLPPLPTMGFFEDGMKFIGIFSWSAYLLKTSYHLVVKKDER